MTNSAGPAKTVRPDAFPPRDGHVILGATVRTLGAWPSGWRHPHAHSDPRQDAAVLRAIAHSAEDAGLQFLFFGDWLATAPEFEFTDPYLLARVEPFAAVSYLAAVTERIGLIATVNTSYSEPYSIARSSASADLLSGGRVALSISAGAEPRSARNYGWDNVHSEPDRLAAAAEFVQVLRGLWDSWEDSAFVVDAAAGTLIDAAKVHALDYVGYFLSSSGPLNVPRPPQGQLPIAVAGSAPAARDLSAREADIAFVSPATFDEAVASYHDTKLRVAAAGRAPDQHLLITPLLPIVAPTREAAWDQYDELVGLVVLESDRDGVDGAADAAVDAGLLPQNRTTRALAGALGIPVSGIDLDDAVPVRTAGRFSDRGKQLVETVRLRSGRELGAARPVTYRHLLVAHSVAVPVLVGSAHDIADHIETWFRARAVDGFTILSAYVHRVSTSDAGQHYEPDAFLALVVPELQRRRVFPADYTGTTLRENLGLPAVANINAGR